MRVACILSDCLNRHIAEHNIFKCYAPLRSMKTIPRNIIFVVFDQDSLRSSERETISGYEFLKVPESHKFLMLNG